MLHGTDIANASMTDATINAIQFADEVSDNDGLA